MKPENLCTIYFSPTGTSRKIAEAIARGFSMRETDTVSTKPDGSADETVSSGAAMPSGTPLVKPIDLTHAAPHSVIVPGNDTAVIAVPVYGGKVAPPARKRLEAIRGNSTPALLAVLYGNRAFEGALAELAEIAAAQGFVPVAAAAFVGEHSYSSKRHPIAAGRPDAADLTEAEAFGRRTAEQLAAAQAGRPADSRQTPQDQQAKPHGPAKHGPNGPEACEMPDAAQNMHPHSREAHGQPTPTEQGPHGPEACEKTDAAQNMHPHSREAHGQPTPTEQGPNGPEACETTDTAQAMRSHGGETPGEPATAKCGIAPINVRKIAHPASGLWPMVRFVRFVLGYRRRQKRHPVVYLPATDPTACVHCGRCVTLCPVEAIAAGREEHTDPARCIRCCACVKGCPVHARTFETPFAAALSRNFRKPKPNVFLPPIDGSDPKRKPQEH